MTTQPTPKPTAPRAAQPAPSQGRSMMDYDRHLKSEHLNGKAWSLTIRAVGEAKLGKPRANEITTLAGSIPNQDAKTPMIFFREVQKYLILSNTNRARLVAMFGPDPAKWIGKQITVKAEAAQVGRETKYPVRVQSPAATGEAPPTPPPPDQADLAATADALGW